MATLVTAKTANNENRKRGAYQFGSTTITPQPAKRQAKKNAATAKKIVSRATSTASKASSAAAKATTAARNNIDLGLASIAKSTSSATRQTASTVSDTVDRNAKVMKGAFANAATNAKQIQDKFTTFSKEVTTNLTQTANRAAQGANTGLELSRQNAEALSQSYKTASQALNRATAELFGFANAAFAENVQNARQALECRNVSDLFQLQSNAFRQNLEAAFGQAMKLSEIAIQTATEALEPINESVSKSSKKISELVS